MKKIVDLIFNRKQRKREKVMALPKLGEGFYTPGDAAKILGIKNSQASYWFRQYARNREKWASQNLHFFQYDNVYAVNFLTLIEMFVFYALRKHGVGATKIIEAHKVIGETLGTPYPFAKRELYISGKTLFFKTFSDDFVKADKSLQIMIEKVIMPFIAKVEYGDNFIAQRFFPLGKKGQVVVDPDHQFGYPTIVGTNIMVDTVVELFEAGEKIKTISSLYGIPHKAVKDAIAFVRAA